MIDVRQEREYAAGHVDGALSVELGSLASPADLPSEHLALTCSVGGRAMTAASLLERSGKRNLTVLMRRSHD